jgi:hypothetical protein
VVAATPRPAGQAVNGIAGSSSAPSTFELGVAYLGDPIEESQERTRVLLAVATMALFLVVAAIILIYIAANGGDDSAKLMITGIFTPIIGVAGTVLGFYFGSPNR